MNDSLPTIWPAEPHTLAKHAILTAYLKAWMPILTRQGAKIAGARRDVRPADSTNNEILYVDGFAGPGKYSTGEDGSPIIALRAAHDHALDFPIPIRFVFIELNHERYESLRVCVRKQRAAMAETNARIEEPIEGDCNAVLSGLLEEHLKRGKRFGPALVFLDQFGYSAVPMSLIAKIMRFDSCEVFSYLDYKYLNRFITDPSKHEGIDSAFGGTEWRAAIDLPPGQREQFLLGVYKRALKSRGNVEYVSHFSMHDMKGQLLYWLLFNTKNLRGLEVMKKAMWSVDKAGTFRFSDSTDPSQTPLFLSDSFDDAWLAEELHKRFKGRTMACEKLREFVLTDTPCVLYKAALGELWRSGKLRSPGRDAGAPPAFQGAIQVEFVDPIQPPLF